MSRHDLVSAPISTVCITHHAALNEDSNSDTTKRQTNCPYLVIGVYGIIKVHVIYS